MIGAIRHAGSYVGAVGALVGVRVRVDARAVGVGRRRVQFVVVEERPDADTNEITEAVVHKAACERDAATLAEALVLSHGRLLGASVAAANNAAVDRAVAREMFSKAREVDFVHVRAPNHTAGGR